MKSLSQKEELFVLEYMKDQNGKQAAIRAGYSERTAKEIAFEILTRPHVKARLAERMKARMDRADIDALWLLRRLADEAEADIADIYDEAGALKPVKEWPKIWRQGLVAGLDVEEITVEGVKMGEVRKVKISDRVKRLELIGKHINVAAFEERVKVDGLGDIADRLMRAAERIKGKGE